MPYSPASNLTSDAGKAHLATVYYMRKGLDVLRKRMYFDAGCEEDILPLRSGLTAQWYRYDLPAANTTPSAEGTVGTGLTSITNTISATLSQYSDFYTLSTLLMDTAIDPIVENHVMLASYRAALTVDTILRTEFDSTSSADLSPLGASFGGTDIRNGLTALFAIDLLEGPRGADKFLLIAHPYVLFDLKSDNTAGGFIDVMKYANPQGLLAGEVGMFDQARIVMSTNVGTSGTAPNLIYRTYLVGRGACGHLKLAGNGPSNVVDPSKQSFKINTIKGGPSMTDPEGNIGAAVSYRFVDVAKLLDTTNFRFRRFLVDVTPV